MKEDIREYKCPCCNGSIEFNAEVQKMKCPYCDTEFEVETLQQYDSILNEDKPEQMSWEGASQNWTIDEQSGLRMYVCESCGGQILGDETLAATSCPFCDSHVILMNQFKGELKPDLVIPFKLEKQEAKEGFKKHLQGKKLLPKMFKEESHIDEIKGIYVPFWLFDAEAEGSFRYRATRVTTWSDFRYFYTDTKYFAVTREGTLRFANVPADGSEKMPDDLMDSLEPYDFSEAVDFQTAYLSGYLADKYDKTSLDVEPRINSRVKQSTADAFRDTVTGYASVTPENSQVTVSRGKVKYALLPLWLLNTTWKGQKYVFAMNGQTGKFVGNLPCDKGIYFRWLLGLGLGIAAAIFGLLYVLLYA